MIADNWKILSNLPRSKNKDWLAKILAKNRGLSSKKQLDEFLNPTLEQILAITLSDTKKALERISKAIKTNEKIIVYSDYDADGICATAIMWETLFDMGADVLPYVPHRVKEGYGLSQKAITTLARQQVKLIITVDHGVTAREQIKYAKKLGVDVIVTDHHLLPDALPEPYALVHSLKLCGAGVAWRLCWDLVKKLNPSYQAELLQKLELASLATIADLVPLTGGNRAIVKIGLEKLAQTERSGIIALIRTSAIEGPIGTYEIGHILAPRINAMGRIEHGLDSLRLLCAKNPSEANRLAQLLSRTNSKRQGLTTKALEAAISMIDKEQIVGVVAHESLHEGVIGLVASRLVETFGKPMVVISRGDIYSKGSARSVAGFNIVEAIRHSSEFLVDGGGHPMAAGFTIKTRHIGEFVTRINDYAQNRLNDHIQTTLNIECELKPKDLNWHTFLEIKKFEPCGVANPQPVFLTKNMLVEDVRSVGIDNKHLKLELEAGFSAIGFNMREKLAEIRPGYLVDLVYTIAEDRYNGGSLQLKLKDLAISP